MALMPNDQSGMSGTDWLNVLAASLGNLKLYPRGYWGSQGQGLNIGAPLLGLAGVAQDKQQRQRNQNAIAQLQQLFPEMSDLNTSGDGLNVQELTRLLPELSARRQEAKRQQAFGALKDIIAPITEAPAERITSAQPMGQDPGAGFDALQSIAYDTGDDQQPPPMRQPAGLDLIGATGAVGGPSMLPADLYRSTERPPSIGEQVGRMRQLPPEIGPYVSELLMPTLVREQSEEAKERRKEGNERVQRARVAQPWVQYAISTGAPAQWANSQRDQFIAGGRKALPDLEGTVTEVKGAGLYRLPPWPGAKPEHLTDATPKSLPPEMEWAWRGYKEKNPDANQWDFARDYFGLKHPGTTHQQRPFKMTDASGNVRLAYPGEGGQPSRVENLGLYGTPQRQPHERGPRVNERWTQLTINDQNKNQFQAGVDAIAGDLTQRGIFKKDTSGYVTKKDGTREPKTRYLERLFEAAHPGTQVKIVYNPQKGRFEVMSAMKLIQTRDMPAELAAPVAVEPNQDDE